MLRTRQGLRKERGFGLTDRDPHDFTRLEATGADFHGFHSTFKQHPQFFQIGVPPPSGGVLGVTHIVPKHGTFVTHFTSLGHYKTLLDRIH